MMNEKLYEKSNGETVDCMVVGAIETNCWIYPLSDVGGTVCGGQEIPSGFKPCAVIDPGDEAERIISHLNKLKLVPLYILITHGHFDHIAALPFLAAAYGTEGRRPVIAIHYADAEYLGSQSYPIHHRSFSAAGGAAFVEARWQAFPPPGLLLNEGDTIGPFTVLHLPGHSPGSIALWDRAARVLFSGDTLFKGDYGRTDLPGGSEEQLTASLKRLFAMDGAIQVYPGHGPSTTIGEEAGVFSPIIV